MKRRLPSTTALAAFESAARLGSFTLAGDELALTQSAIGRQIGKLEALLGVALFRRTRRGVALTPAGIDYSRTVRRRLEQVEQDVRQIAQRGAGGGAIDIGVVPTFATHWLVPRLKRFAAEHPGMQVNLHVRTRPFLFEEARLDAAIQPSEAGWPGTQAEPLMKERMLLVCSPDWTGRRKRLRPAELAKLPLIQMTTRPYAWRQWFARHQLRLESDMHGPQVELFSMAIQAAVHGQGLALVPDYAVQDDLRHGRLVQPVAAPFESGLGYFLLWPDGGGGEVLAAFRRWIVAESAHAAD